MYIYTVTCQNCKKQVQDEQHVTLVTRQEWGKTKCGIGVQKFICDECLDNFS